MYSGFRFGRVWVCAAAMVAWGVCARAQVLPVVAEPPPTPHVLVYPDGDRVQGRVIAREGDVIVFRSARFGDIRVASSEVTVITAPVAAKRALTPVTSEGVAVAGTEPAAAHDPEGFARLLKSVFGDWHGRFAFSSQFKRDTSDTSDLMVEGTMRRSWARDEVSVTARYSHNETNNIDTTDKATGNGLWRHTLASPFFALYRPYYEWNRTATLGAVKSNYVLLQQEVGVGLTLVNTERWNVKTGVSENFFDNWDLSNDTHLATQAESVFVEAEVKLPWRVTITERAVYFYSFRTGNDGWESQFEINKKLTDTLTLGLRHEVRYNDPDLRTEDYSLLRLLLGFDF